MKRIGFSQYHCLPYLPKEHSISILLPTIETSYLQFYWYSGSTSTNSHQKMMPMTQPKTLYLHLTITYFYHSIGCITKMESKKVKRLTALQDHLFYHYYSIFLQKLSRMKFKLLSTFSI